MITVDKAKAIILKEILPLSEMEFLAFSSCLNRISAQDIKAKENIPPFNNSAMDGFAVRAKDTLGASRRGAQLCAPTSVLQVIEDLPAGYAAKKSVKPGQAIRIMTGAPLPRGADAVVMVENTEPLYAEKCHSEGAPKGRPKNLKREILRLPLPLPLRSAQGQGQGQPQNDMSTETRVKIFKQVRSGENVRYAGEDVKRGEVVIKKGARLGAGHIGMLASLGVSKVKVFGRPKVAILATGDELVEVGAKLKPGKIRNSNTYSLYSQVVKTGAVPVILGIARDKKTELEKKIRKGLTADILLVSGGVSVGDYDFVKDVLKDLGGAMKFWKVAMRPGKPLAFGMIKGVPVFGLPGNPVSSMLSFEIFVRPAILKMMGQGIDEKTEVAARIEENIPKKKGLRYFLRANTRWDDITYLTKTTGPQGSGQLKSMVLANSIIILPEEKEFVKKGEEVKLLLLN